MQLHRNCNWIANKIKLLFDDIVKVVCTQNRFCDFPHFSKWNKKGHKSEKKNNDKKLVPVSCVEMDYNKHATNVDNLTRLGNIPNPFSNAQNLPACQYHNNRDSTLEKLS